MNKLRKKFGKRTKYNYKRTFVGLFLFLLVLGIGIVYATLTTNLSINGTSHVKSSRWDVHFENVQMTAESVIATVEPTIVDNTTVNFDVTLEEPGDVYEFTIDIVNDGSLDAKLGSMEILPNLTSEQQNYFSYTVTYSNGIEINENDALDSGKTERIKVRVEYKELANSDLYPSEDDNIEFSVTMNYEQGKGNEVNHSVSFANDSWSVIAATVKNGNTSNYNLGDTKEIDMGEFGTHTIRIVNKSTPDECSTEGFSQTACGFVIDFADVIIRHTMNSTATNIGGWPASELRTYINSNIYNALPSDLKSVIIDTMVVSGHGSDDTTNFISTDKLYLLSKKEVVLNSDTAESDTRRIDFYDMNTVQYRMKKYDGSNYTWYLRTANPTDNERYGCVTGGDGYGINLSADRVLGVSPAFRIG